MSKSLARILSVFFLLLGIVSCWPNRWFGTEGYFAVNLEHAAIYMFASALLLAFSFRGESTAAMGHYLTAALVLFLGLLGFRELDSRPYSNANIFGAILYNHSDLWLDLTLGGVLLISGLLNTSKRQVLRD